MASSRAAERMYPLHRIWSCRPMATTRTSCASSMRSMSICGRARTMPSGEDVRRSTRRNPRPSPRPRMSAWADRGDCVMNHAGIHRIRLLAVAVALLLLVSLRAGAQTPGPGSPTELVAPNTFRVCADPRNLPFSNEAGEGFENKLAELFARKLGEPTSYTYYPQV